jgi:hypothetical protein
VVPSANLRVDTNLVLVAATDEFNRPITGLEKENFKDLRFFGNFNEFERVTEIIKTLF